MVLKELKFYNFRNLLKSTIQFHPSVNIFLGPNGQGKTNLLESIFVLSFGGTFRPGKAEVLIKRGETCGYVEGRYLDKNLTNTAKVEFVDSRKRMLHNNKSLNNSNLKNKLFSVLFSPESLAVIKDGPDARRTLIDEIGMSIHPDYSKKLADFKKALNARNKVLKNYKNHGLEKKSILGVLESLNPIYFEKATDLTHHRLSVVRILKSELSPIYNSLIEGENVEISVEYLISSKNGVDWTASHVYNNFLDRAKDLADAELSAGTTLIGPHKHDIRFLVNQEDSRYFCSQGQQRTLIIAVKMGQILLFKKKHDSYPLLLLDDVLSELDLTKRTKLVKFLNNIEAQIFLTTTDLAFKIDEVSSGSRFLEGDFFVFEINNGEIVKSESNIG